MWSDGNYGDLSWRIVVGSSIGIEEIKDLVVRLKSDQHGFSGGYATTRAVSDQENVTSKREKALAYLQAKQSFKLI